MTDQPCEACGVFHAWLDHDDAPDTPDDVIAAVRTIAELHGYAIGVHGSLVRDIDLIAVPWVERADQPERLVAGLAEGLDAIYGPPNAKPHGRIGWLIKRDAPPHIDLSVMPPTMESS